MIAEQMRIPDLWLKREIALAILPPGSDLRRVTNQILAQCVRGEQGTASKLNHLIAGDDPIRVADDLYFLAAALEYLILEGPPEGFGRADVERYLARTPDGPALWPQAMLGTFGEFAQALLRIVARRSDFERLGPEHFRMLMRKAVHQNLHDLVGETAEEQENLIVLSGPTRNWAHAAGGVERVIRQPSRERPRVKEGDHVQLVVPAAPSAQTVFGFELCTDERVLTEPWADVGSWFAPRYQPANVPIPLLAEFEDDTKNPRAIGRGDFWIQIVGVETDASAPPGLPGELSRLVAGHPADWPDGYAEAMATVTLVSRMDHKAKRLRGIEERAARNLERQPGDEIAVPTKARLYRAQYSVIP